MSGTDLDRVEHLIDRVSKIITFSKVVISALISIFALVIGVALWVNHVNTVQAANTATIAVNEAENKVAIATVVASAATETRSLDQWRRAKDEIDVRLTALMEGQQKQAEGQQKQMDILQAITIAHIQQPK